MLPAQRTLNFLRAIGVPCDKAEHWVNIPKSRNPAGGIRKDLFNFIDIVALYPGRIVGIQCTSDGAVRARAKKIAADPLAQKWMESNGGIEVWGWKRCGKRGERKLWRHRALMAVVTKSGITFV